MKPRENMCLSCVRATVVTYERELGAASIYCHSMEKHLPREVFECSSYTRQNEMDISELSHIAWIIEHDPGKTHPGFIKPGTKLHQKIVDKDQKLW